MLKRVAMSLALLVVLFLLLLFNGVLIRPFIFVFGLLAQWEVYGAFRKGGYKPTVWTGMVFVGLLQPVYFYAGLEAILGLYMALNAINLVWMVFMPDRELKDTMASIFAMFYPGWCILMILMLAEWPVKELSLIALALTFLIPCANDIFAFLTGTFFGKTQLAPRVSPKKTVEGAVGGFVFGILVAAGAGLFFRHVLDYTIMPMTHFLIIGASCGLFGQVGDLTASALKRAMGIKDFSHFFGSHGGVMDRADSIFMGAVALFVFYTMMYR